jgi:hypothetical protein
LKINKLTPNLAVGQRWVYWLKVQKLKMKYQK